MKTKRQAWSRRYEAALRRHIASGRGTSLTPALRIGRQAVALKMETLDVARFHEQALAKLVRSDLSAATRKKAIERSRVFFDETVVAIERTHAAALKDNARFERLTLSLHLRSREAAEAARRLTRGIVHRRAAEASLAKRQKRHAELLLESRRLQKRLRNLTHACLTAQENERRRISDRLHDDVAQRLLGIQVRLLVLQEVIRSGRERLKKETGDTQRLVRQSFGKGIGRVHALGVRHKA